MGNFFTWSHIQLFFFTFVAVIGFSFIKIAKTRFDKYTAGMVGLFGLYNVSRLFFGAFYNGSPYAVITKILLVLLFVAGIAYIGLFIWRMLNRYGIVKKSSVHIEDEKDEQGEQE